jgi:small GTP-binding protein
MSKTSNKNLKKISYKIVLLGNSQVGKTSFFKKLTKKTFNERNISTIGIDKANISRIIRVPEDPLDSSSEEKEIEFSIDFLDTAGQERYRSITSGYFKNSQGLLLLYDITNKKSFEDVEVWMKSVLDNLGEKESNKKRIYSLILIGNKIDLEENRVITKEEGEEICKKNNMISWGGEISIKDMSKEELEDKFIEMMKIIYKDIGNPENKNMVTKKLNEEKIKKKKRDNNLCCEKK